MSAPSRTAMQLASWAGYNVQHDQRCDARNEVAAIACDPDCRVTQLAIKIDALIAAARREALEEAAKIADEYNKKGGYSNWSDLIAEEIRALAARGGGT